MYKFVRTLFLLLALACFAGTLQAQTALPPDITKHPVASSINAKNATLMLYVQALPRDEGKLTYQWYTSTTPDGGAPESKKIAGKTNYTLNINTPATAGTYYYWCVVTNTNGTATATSESNITKVTIIDKSLDPKLMNGGFQEWWDFDGYTVQGKDNSGLTAANRADQNLGLSPKRKPSTGTGFALPPVAADVDNSGASYQRGIKYWNTTHANTSGQYSGGKVTQLMAANGFGNNNNYLDTVWTAPNGNVIRHNDYYDPNNLGPDFTASGTTYKVYRDFYLVVELCADQSSSLYQEIATVPGKIYEWSICHALRGSTAGDVVSVVIGPAINSTSDYHTPTDNFGNSVTNRWGVGNGPYNIGTGGGTNVGSGQNQYYNFNRTCTYPYGSGNGVSYFVDVVNKVPDLSKGTLTDAQYYTKLNNQNGNYFVSSYNDRQYYVFVSSADLTQGAAGTYNGETGAKKINWRYQSGVYSVPEGQGLTVFSFVGLYSSAGATAGNILDNIVFKSGNTPVSVSAMFYSGKVSLSAITQTNYVYGIAEVRGSSVTNFNLDVTGGSVYNPNPTNPDGISNWYSPGGTSITFEDLIPGKTYRIIGIPAGAVSGASEFNTNKSPAEVLDDGYYTEITIPAAWEGNDKQMATATASAVSDTEANIFVTNTNPGVEYALIDYDYALSPSDEHYVVFPWTSGLGLETGAPLVFDGLEPDHCYVVVARPKGYNEISYQDAAVLSPKGSGLLIRTPAGGKSALQDILRSEVIRDHDGATDKITLTTTDTRGKYGIYDPSNGEFIALVTGTGGEMEFKNLNPDKIYHLTVKEINSTSSSPCSNISVYMVGVRVYPFPHLLQIDYVNERIYDSSNATNQYISKEIEYRMQALDTNNTWLVGNGKDVDNQDAATWRPATGTSYLELGLKQGSNASLLDSIKILGATEAMLHYRLHPVDVDGWIGPSVQPEATSPLSIPMRPDHPVKNECGGKNNDYTIDYRIIPEVLQVNTGSLAYSLDNGNTFTTIPSSEILLSALGWAVAPKTVPLRFPAIPDVAFASDTTMQLLLGRGPAPISPYAEMIDANNINIKGLVVDSIYQYRVLGPNNNWSLNFTGATETGALPYDNVDYEIRYAPTCAMPASLSRVLSTPLYVMPVNFGTVPYGYSVAGRDSAIIVRNVSDISVNFDNIVLDDNTYFSIIPSADITVPGKTADVPGENKDWMIVPSPGLVVGYYHATILLTHGTSTASADVYLEVEKIKWDNNLEASLSSTATYNQFCLDIDGSPYPTDEVTGNNATIEYGINTDYDQESIGVVTNSCFTGLESESEYTVYYRVKEDANHYASDPETLTVYTPYYLNCSTDVTYIDYEQEMLFFNTGYLSQNYEVRVNDVVVTMPYQVSAEAENATFTVSVRRKDPAGIIPPSDPCSYIVTGRPAAPGGVTTPGNNKIALSSNFQYRRAGNPNIMANWQAALNQTGTLEWGGYEVRRPASNADQRFASKYTTVFLAPNLTPDNHKLYVDIARLDGLGAGNGSSWRNATPSLSSALKYAQDNIGNQTNRIDSIFVAIGTYKPEVSALSGSTDNRDFAFVLPPNVIVTGGYQVTWADINTVGIVNTQNKSSVLSGDLGAAGDAYHVLIAANAANTTLNRFVITGGNANESGSITVNTQMVSKNNGGGVYVAGTTSLKLINVAIYGNKATDNGGGVYVASNTSTATITNVTIAGNTANSGGGIYKAGGTLNLYNTIVYGNTTGQIYGTPDVNINNMIDGVTDPHFYNAATNNYRLQSDSPAKDAGIDGNYQTQRNDPNFNWTNEFDVAGKERNRGSAIDIGAYEVPFTIQSTSTTICSGDTLHLYLDYPATGTYSSSDPIVAYVVGNSGELYSDVDIINNAIVPRQQGNPNEGMGGTVTVTFATADGSYSTKEIIVTPRAKTPKLRWVFDGICTVDQSDGADDSDEITVFLNQTYEQKGWTNPYGNKYLNDDGMSSPIVAGQPITDHLIPDSTSIDNYFANLMKWDYLVNNYLSDSDPRFYNQTLKDAASPFSNIKWYEDSGGEPGMLIRKGGETLPAGDNRLADFWQNEPHGPETYWARIKWPAGVANPDSCKSYAIKVQVNIFQTPEQLNVTNIIGYVQPAGSTIDLDDQINTDNMLILEWYKTQADADNAYHDDDASIGINDYTIPPPTDFDLSQVVDTTFWLMRADNSGCRSLPTPFRVQLYPMPEISIVPDTVCPGVITPVTVNITGTAPYRFQIKDGSGVVIADEAAYLSDTYTFPVNIHFPTDYYVTLFSDAIGPLITDNALGLNPPSLGYYSSATIDVAIIDIISVSPVYGPVEGGIYTNSTSQPIDPAGTVSIKGSGFTFDTAVSLVTFGGIPATNITVENDSIITCTPPAHGSGNVTVSLSTACGILKLVNGYRYEAMNIIDITPNYAPVTGGTEVIIRGVGFEAIAGATTVNLCGVPAIIDHANSSNILIKCTTGESNYALLDTIEIFNGNEIRKFAKSFTYYPVVFIENGLWSTPHNWERQTADHILPYPNAKIHIKANCLQDIDVDMDSITVYPSKAYTLDQGITLQAKVFTLKDNASFLDYNTLNGRMQALQQNLEHLLAKGRNWYVSSPVQSGIIPEIYPALGRDTLGNDLDASGEWRVEYYDESQHNWVRNDKTDPFVTGLGYTAYSQNEDIAVKFSGTYTDGDQITPFNLTRQNDGHPKRGFNLVGNPFPSYWHWTSEAALQAGLYSTIWYRTNVDNIYEFWSYNASGDVAVAPGWEDAMPTGSYSLAYIPPMQAFWVRMLDGPSSSALTFANYRRTHADHNSNILKSSQDETDTRPLLRLGVSNGKSTDETLIYADPSATDGFDDYDSDKWFRNQGVEIFTLPVASDRELVINGFPEITAGMEVPLGFQADEGGAFSIRAKEIVNLDPFDVILRDKWRNIEFDLGSGNDYHFTSGSASNTERFSIVFHPAQNTGGFDKESGDKLLAYADPSGQITVALYIQDRTGSKADVWVFDIAGRKLLEQSITVGERSLLETKFKEGVYLLRAGKWSAKVVVK